ncbi:TPA: hypothetical protein N2A67_006485 [Pseudomonas aeruginosa]|nr:hypothetical protein [Pseudomonas aeruginosa]HEQ2037043.1 hypothetical protein [Pseudomonas aeruginosa]
MFGLIVWAVIIFGWVGFATTFKGTGIHPSDVAIGGFAVAYAAWYILKNIGNSTGIAFLISWAVTGASIYWAFAATETEGSFTIAAIVIMSTWILTVTKVIPALVSVVIGCSIYALRGHTNKV